MIETDYSRWGEQTTFTLFKDRKRMCRTWRFDAIMMLVVTQVGFVKSFILFTLIFIDLLAAVAYFFVFAFQFDKRRSW